MQAMCECNGSSHNHKLIPVYPTTECAKYVVCCGTTVKDAAGVESVIKLFVNYFAQAMTGFMLVVCCDSFINEYGVHVRVFIYPKNEYAETINRTYVMDSVYTMQAVLPGKTKFRFVSMMNLYDITSEVKKEVPQTVHLFGDYVGFETTLTSRNIPNLKIYNDTVAPDENVGFTYKQPQ